MKNYKLGFYSINTLICIYTLYTIIIKSDFIIEAQLLFFLHLSLMLLCL